MPRSVPYLPYIAVLALACAFSSGVTASDSAGSAPSKPRHIIKIVGDDVGYNDLGFTNGGRVHTPNLDSLRHSGIMLSNYHAFKICSPTRSSLHSGRYPWGVGFYDMSQDLNHQLLNYTLLPELLQDAGYRTHAIGKWDIGFIKREITATYKGYDTFYGYYTACQHDYWYHGAAGGAEPCNCTDLSFNQDHNLTCVDGVNGTYNAHLFTERAVDIIAQHNPDEPLYIYLAYMNVHEGCSSPLPLQAPLATVQQYGHVELDTYKVAAAMYTEMDTGVGQVIQALKSKGMWDETLVVFVSDNGGPLDHATNAPLRGGKHTFFEGGVRVMSFVSSPTFPPHRRNTTWDGMAHASDWYATLVEGVAGAKIPDYTGPRPMDGYNLWQHILDDTASPRTEIIHQVNNTHFTENVSVITVNEMKLIRGVPGDSRTIGFPAPSPTPVPLGKTGAVVEPGTDHVRSIETGKPIIQLTCHPYCLFNLTADLVEQNDLVNDTSLRPLAEAMMAKLDAAGRTGPPQGFFFPAQEYQNVTHQLFTAGQARGFLQPLDF